MADQKITDLTENTILALGDLFPMVDDPAGTPATMKVSLDTLLSLFTTHSVYRQAIINGNFDITQRGTSFTANGKCFDRWYQFQTSSAITVSQQDGSGVSGSKYCARVQRNSGSSNTNDMFLLYAGVETREAEKLAGMKVTLSFYARKGSNYSASGNSLTVNIKSGTGTNENFGNSNVYATGPNTDYSGSITLTNNWTKYTITIASALGSSVSEISVSFVETPTGTAGVSDYFEITQVQLCAGTVALPFYPASINDELRRCKRFYEKSYRYTTYAGTAISAGNDTAAVNTGTNTTNRITLSQRFSVEKVKAPTLTLYDWAGTSGKITELSTADSATNGNTPSYSTSEEAGFYVSHSPSTKAGIAFAWVADAEL